MKKKKIIVAAGAAILLLWLFIPLFIGLWAKLASCGRVKLSFFLTPPGARVIKFQWKIFEKPLIALGLKGSVKVPWKSFIFGSQQLLAFQAPGNITLPEGKSKVNFSAELQGNFKTGELNIKKGDVWLEKFGKIFVSGKLVKWGKEICEIEGDVKNFSIDEFRNLLGIQNLPFSATITGKLSVSINKDIVKLIKFDIDFNKLLFQQHSKPLSGHVKGNYDFLSRKCFIETGNILTETGGKLSLKGLISEEEFNVKIDSEGLSIEEIISQLPEKWQEKIKFKTNSGISINGDAFWKKQSQLPFFAGLIFVPGELVYKNFSCSDLTLTGSQETQQITIFARKINFAKIKCDEIKGKITRINEKYKGNITFNFYDGSGNVSFVTNENMPLKIYARAEINKINLLKLVQSLNPDIVVTGLVNVISFLEIGNKEFSMQAKIDNIPQRPFSQKLNISAVRALASLGSSGFAGSIGRKFGSSDFYYRKLSGVISITNGQLTIEGTAKKAGDNDYLVTSEIFGSGINVLVDRKNNSIHIEDLKQRISNAMKQNKAQLKFS